MPTAPPATPPAAKPSLKDRLAEMAARHGTGAPAPEEPPADTGPPPTDAEALETVRAGLPVASEETTPR